MVHIDSFAFNDQRTKCDTRNTVNQEKSTIPQFSDTRTRTAHPSRPRRRPTGETRPQGRLWLRKRVGSAPRVPSHTQGALVWRWLVAPASHTRRCDPSFLPAVKQPIPELQDEPSLPNLSARRAPMNFIRTTLSIFSLKNPDGPIRVASPLSKSVAPTPHGACRASENKSACKPRCRKGEFEALEISH